MKIIRYNYFLPRFSNYSLAVFRDVCFLLPVPEVEEEEEEDEGEGVDGHGAVVQEREEFAHDVAGVPLHHVDSLDKIKKQLGLVVKADDLQPSFVGLKSPLALYTECNVNEAI